jgi:hypothetical protein
MLHHHIENALGTLRIGSPVWPYVLIVLASIDFTFI